MAYKTVNIELGYPDVLTAMERLTEEIYIAKKSGYKALKIIHGYGSSGKGGKIKRATIKQLDRMLKNGNIKFYVKGEEFGNCFLKGQEAVKRYKELRKDCDFGRQNDGISVILF